MGLAVGMASFIIIMLWVIDELSFDKFNLESSRIVRTNIIYSMEGNEHNLVICPPIMGPAIKDEFAEVENFVRFRDYGRNIIQFDDKSFTERNVLFADSTIFDVFTIHLTKGNPKTSLKAPNTVTISESMAKKYFGTDNPLGKILRFNNRSNFEVTGVFKDIPKNSHFQSDFIASLYSNDEYNSTSWLDFDFQTYILLKENTDQNAFEKKLTMLIDKYFSAEISQRFEVPWEKIKESGSWFSIKAQKLTDIHLHSNSKGELAVNGDIKYVYIFVTIAIFILLLACINFINLSTAKSLERLKEVGMKKVFGVKKMVLIKDFLLESFIAILIALIVALILVEVLLPFFNSLSSKSLHLTYFNPFMLLGLLALIVLTSIIAGSYPAFYLSSFQPISALKSEITKGKNKTTLRSILVIGQFVISIGLLTSSFIVQQQMKYIQKRELGFGKENLISIWNTYLLGKSIDTFKEELLNNPNIKSATMSSYLPIPSQRSSSSLFKDGVRTVDVSESQLWRVDYDYLQTIGLEIVKGRGFSKEFITDSKATIINEAATRYFGWDDPIGKNIGVPREEQIAVYNVIGVVKDFNYESVHAPVEPLALFLGKSTGIITILLESKADIKSSISYLESMWKKYATDQPFEFTFFDDQLNQLYKPEVRLGKILTTFTFLAFLISCLGLLGLAIFAAEIRKKEVGIRKIMGASVGRLVFLLSYDFTKLVIWAFIIACPISFFIMSKWLENFAYKTNISIWIFVLTGLLSYFTALIAILIKTYRAASSNPIQTLRNE
jgi:putative ABC transport system permease protein